jgi:hypothetical protein
MRNSTKPFVINLKMVSEELIEEGIGVLPLALPESASGEGGSGSLQ